MKSFFTILAVIFSIVSIVIVYGIAEHTEKQRIECQKLNGVYYGYNGGICLKKDSVIKLEGE